VSDFVVIGIGNPFRGDDGVGRRVASWLRGRMQGKVRIVESDGEPAMLIGHLEGLKAACLIDACRSGAAPGTVRRFDVSASPLPQELSAFSTHGIGIGDVLELARALGQLPRRCTVYAVETASFELGDALSPAVADAVVEVGERILAEVFADAMEDAATHA
jgi:hydrogenase maturation protease